eukprot:maker-scaffold_5-snap-gene-8.10-mRNA-1 protein AED:0.08 eAED:0.09 QI:0/0/0.5/1/0/0/2/188/262
MMSETSLSRQALTLSVFTLISSYALYFIPATLNYWFLFDKNLMKHKKFKEGQIWMEIDMAAKAVPVMGLMTVPFFLLEINGYTKLYDDITTKSLLETLGLVFLFFMWNDFMVYWIHRWLHLPWVYRTFHKPHHKWLIPSPFASHAFHPFDGWVQGLPYHLFTFVLPMHKWLFLFLFFMVNMWTISIHDEYFMVPDKFNLRKILNCAAHHTDHHIFFNYNHGLYFTLWDRIGGTYRTPGSFVGKGPYDDLKDPKKLHGYKKDQ